MTEYLLKALTVILWSSVKYLIGFFIAIGSMPHFGFFETVLFNVSGGMLGVFVSLYLWDFLLMLWNRFFPKKISEGIKINNFRRWLVKFINKYELLGIVILTPVLFTPPVGTILAAAIDENKWRIKRLMLFSFIGWTSVFYLMYSIFGFRLDEWISNLW